MNVPPSPVALFPGWSGLAEPSPTDCRTGNILPSPSFRLVFRLAMPSPAVRPRISTLYPRHPRSDGQAPWWSSPRKTRSMSSCSEQHGNMNRVRAPLTYSRRVLSWHIPLGQCRAPRRRKVQKSRVLLCRTKLRKASEKFSSARPPIIKHHSNILGVCLLPRLAAPAPFPPCRAI